VRKHTKRVLSFSMFFFALCIISFGESAEKQVTTVILDSGHGGSDQGGYDGRGFKLEDGRRVPEDAYAFDIALRIARFTKSKRWNSRFTVISERTIQEESPGSILPALFDLTYNNMPREKIRVFGGKEGVRKRIDVIRQMPGIDQTNAIFIALHFDYAPPHVSGTRIFTTGSGSKHPFVKILAKHFSAAGLSLHIRSNKAEAITINEKLIVLKDGILQPRVLIEFGNFNNQRDRALMMSPHGRELYAYTVVAAIEEYISSQP